MRRMTKVGTGRRLVIGSLGLGAVMLAAPWAMTGAMAATLTVTPADGAKVSGAVAIHASISGQNGNVSTWTVQIARNPAPNQPRQYTTLSGCRPTSTTVDCTWDSTHVLGSTTALAPNDKYFVKVSAKDSGSLTAASQTYTNEVGLYVQNAPSTPTGLVVAPDEASARMNVTWNANPEPDIAKYILHEVTPDGAVRDWTIPTCASCSFARSYTLGGTYSYNVRTVRNAPNPDGTTAQLSSPATTTKSATVASPNPTTTTTTTTTRPSTTTTGPSGGGGGGNNNNNNSDPTGGGSNGGSGSDSTSGGSGSVFVNGFRVEQIAGGDPGNVTTSGSTGGRAIAHGGALGGGEDEGPDGGFQETLPYKKNSGSDQPPSIATQIANIPSRVLTDESARKAALTIPAVGLLLFVFAMQVRYVTRRAGQEP